MTGIVVLPGHAYDACGEGTVTKSNAFISLFKSVTKSNWRLWAAGFQPVQDHERAGSKPSAEGVTTGIVGRGQAGI